ncbi:LRRC24 [Branchiostoma lanceolatum]|uniref:LRRC24 protein n=1 Tax=Branchiostoma lanceolatum TaxID=7740 RepID=A0A8K0EZ54_BRALA|nr:LRRC24 [Branchiostoma lanceolatum]
MKIPSLFLLGVFIDGFVGCLSSSDLDRCSLRGGNPPTAIICTRSGALRAVPAPLPDTLTSLVIKFQTIRTIERGKLPGLPDLRVLTIHGSKVAEVEVGAFDTVPNVTNLDLTMNKIRKLEAGTFRGLGRLKFLNLALNHLYSIDNGTFSGLQKLEWLDLAKNCLQRIPTDTWMLKSLQDLVIVYNMIQQPSLGDVTKFEHNGGMNIRFGGRIICDCELRKIKQWIAIKGRSRLDVLCSDEKGQQNWLSSYPLERLACEPPEVSVTLRRQAVDAPETAFLTCQADCQENLHFSWLLPNGKELPSTSESSRKRTSARTLHCMRKGSNVRTHVRKTTCYSVLNITAIDNPNYVSGTYTCRVQGNYTKSAAASAPVNLGPIQRPDVVPYETTPRQDFSTTLFSMVMFSGSTTPPGQLKRNASFYHGIVAASSVCVILVLVVIVRKCRMRKEEEPVRCRRGQDKDTRQVSNQDDGNNIHEMNDNNGEVRTEEGGIERATYDNEEDAGGVTYENEEDAGGVAYENEEDAGGVAYENEEDAGGVAYENEEDTGGVAYENEDQFSDPYENDSEFWNEEEVERTNYENDPQFSNQDKRSVNRRRVRKTRSGNNGASGRGKILRANNAADAENLPKPRRINREKLRASMCRVTVTKEELGEEQYDNDKRGSHLGRARQLRSETDAETSKLAVQESWHYDNELRRGGKISTKHENTRRIADGNMHSDSTVAIMESESGHYDNDIQNRRDTSTRPKRTRRTDIRTTGSSTDQNFINPSDADLCDSVAFVVPGRIGHCDNEGQLVDFLEPTQTCHKRVSDWCSRDHVRRNESDDHVVSYDRHDTSGVETCTKDADDYITVRNGDSSESDSPYTRKTNPNITKTSTSDDESNGNDSDHKYFGFPDFFKIPSNNRIPDDASDDSTDHDYVTLPADIDYVTLPPAEIDYVTFPTSPSPSEHDYVTFPTSTSASEHDYVTFPTSPSPSEINYVTFPTSTSASRHDSVTFPTSPSPSEHDYITFPEGHKDDDLLKTAATGAVEHSYVTFPDQTPTK